MRFSEIIKIITLSGSADTLMGFLEVIVASLVISLEMVALNRIVWTYSWT